MNLSSKTLQDLCHVYGDAFYLLDSNQFRQNFCELKSAFENIYSKFNIAYSYKTNYTPKLCALVDQLGGYAEIVSDMELKIAQQIKVNPAKIIWNGPYKNREKMQELLLLGGTINLDSYGELEEAVQIAKRHPNNRLRIGIRCNFDVNDGVTSRFGFDVGDKNFTKAVQMLQNSENIHFTGLQCHFACRRLDTWRPRMEGMLHCLDKLEIVPEQIDLGGGLFGKMDDSLKKQFDVEIPTYQQYAAEVAYVIAEHYAAYSKEQKPLLLIEPGTALVGDCMSFAAKVVNIKEIRGKAIATLLGSIYNINPTLNNKNPSIFVYNFGGTKKQYNDLDFGGFTCIESDYLYRHYCGELAQDDMVVFHNVGSYSIVLKPPFILPNFPILDVCGEQIEVVKNAECFDDLFHTFTFPQKGA